MVKAKPLEHVLEITYLVELCVGESTNKSRYKTAQFEAYGSDKDNALPKEKLTEKLCGPL